MINYLVYVQIIVFLSYIVFLQSKFGTLPSISQSYYELKERGYLFTVFCFSLAIPMMIISGFQDHKYSWLIFMSGVGLGFVGSATSFKQRTTDIVHYTGAVVSIVFALVGIWVVYGLWLPFAFTALLSTAIIRLRVNNAIYWIEVVAVSAIVFGLLHR